MVYNRYSRYEVLAGYANGITLVFVAVYVFLEAVGRLYDPIQVGNDSMMTVAVIGLLVNLVGLIFFHDSSHGHSHGGGSHGHSHSIQNENSYGVFLHILADFLGSVGVIISTFLVNRYSWHRSDPICSIMISFLILISSGPLISAAANTLLQRAPQGVIQGCIQHCCDKVSFYTFKFLASNYNTHTAHLDRGRSIIFKSAFLDSEIW